MTRAQLALTDELLLQAYQDATSKRWTGGTTQAQVESACHWMRQVLTAALAPLCAPAYPPLLSAEELARHVDDANALAAWIDKAPLPPAELTTVYHAHVMYSRLIERLSQPPAPEGERTCGTCRHWDRDDGNSAFHTCLHTDSPCENRPTPPAFSCNLHAPKEPR